MPSDTFAQFDASGWPFAGEETDGGSEHRWLRRPDDDRLWLYKPVEVKSGHRQGEDWAEKTVSEVARLLTIPAAAVDLVERDGSPGLVSRDIKPADWDLQPGAALLGGFVKEYEPRSKFRTGHTVENIALALADMGPPPSASDSQGLSAYDVFCGYLVLDAVVANRDRHDHNWAVLVPPTPGIVRLAPSFDHASSLGFNLTEAECRERLEQGRVEQWARRGSAYRFEHRAPASSIETLVELSVRALRAATPLAQQRWRSAVAALSMADVRDVVSANPVMSDPAATFAVAVMSVNRDRLLDAWKDGEP